MKFASVLPVKSSASGILVSGEVPPVSDASVQTLTSLAKDFEELAHTCLLVLHLEVGVCGGKGGDEREWIYDEGCGES